MGNGQSQEELEKVGYRVLGVAPHSPGSAGGFVSFFDFIVAANGVPLRSMDSTFVDLIKAFEEKELVLTVYNSKSRTIRECNVIPSRNWPGDGYLGIIIRFDTFHDAEEHICRVLDVEPNSPAELAGLQPLTDYLLGTTEAVFKNSDIVFDVLKANLDRPLEVYVYNSETDEVRICVLMPTTDWGGEGVLGASVAHGFLHTLPERCCQTIGIAYDGATRGLQSAFGRNQIHSDIIEPSLDSSASNSTSNINGAGNDA